ncbi:MAG: membrane integrity-associated transporter subunit PqiC [Alphaproteobacteria bacterium]|nr:membrane integrity-associated transporter subunit PqiC [Alphaproteobacteria bacterium]
MTQPVKSSGLAAPLLTATLLLSACGPLISFGDDGPSDTVYTLRYEGAYAADSTQGTVVFVDEPTLAEGLNSDKVAVTLESGQRMTLEGVRWSAQLSDLVRDYVTRSLGDGSGAQMVSAGGLDIRTSCRLGVKVWALEYRPGSRAGDDIVDVAMEVSLVRLSDSQLLSKPTFTQSVTVNGQGDAAVMAAFNQAMRSASGEMTRWFKEQLASCSTGS